VEFLAGAAHVGMGFAGKATERYLDIAARIATGQSEGRCSCVEFPPLAVAM
jgi:hypothetical protein